EALAQVAERRGLIVFSDEIYDQMTYDDAEFVPMATLVRDTLCATLSGLSKVYRACGYRVGWAVFSGRTHAAGDYLNALELLTSLRLCSNVLAQWAVQTALGGHQSIRELVSPGGRLHDSRAAILAAVHGSRFLRLAPPGGGDVRLRGRGRERAAGFRRPAIHARPARAEARAGRARRELQRAVLQSLPHHQPPGCGHAPGRLSPHRGAAERLRGRGPRELRCRGHGEQRGERHLALQVTYLK